jgi:hypothetical protein
VALLPKEGLTSKEWQDRVSPFPGKFDIAERSIRDRLSIDTTIYEQGEILALLSDQDMQKIGVQLGASLQIPAALCRSICVMNSTHALPIH